MQLFLASHPALHRQDWRDIAVFNLLPLGEECDFGCNDAVGVFSEDSDVMRGSVVDCDGWLMQPDLGGLVGGH